MSTIFERLASGPGGLQQQDYHDWNQMVGSAPPGQFGQAVTQAMQQVPSQDYYNHTQPGTGGTDPFGQLQPQQRGGLAGALIGALTGGGLNPQQIMQGSGVSTLNPNQMSSGDLAQLSQWTHQNQPQAFGPVAQQYQQQPDILHSLLGNKALMMAAATMGASFLANQSRHG
jgi:hypothetical protein